jgi:osmotically-inducible protein OsmY
MEYSRVDMQLARGGWARGLRIAGALPGVVRGIVVRVADRTIAYTLVTRRHAPHSSADAGQAEPATAPLPEGSEVITGAARALGPSGSVGRVTRVWVDRVSGRVTHVLVRQSRGLLREGPERIVPAELVDGFARDRVRLKLNAEEVAALPPYRPDSAIGADVRAALEGVLADPRARRGVKVHVDDGHVMLAGEVDTVVQTRLAERAASAVPGVRGLTVDLVAQETLAAAVEARIAALGVVGSNGHADIQVLAEHGIVYLDGSVPSASVRAQVEQAALAANGAKVVVNNLRVDGQPPDRSSGTWPVVRNR